MSIEESVRKALKEVIDPELRIDVVTLGLIYNIESDKEGNVKIKMTFTSMMCPYGPAMVEDVKEKTIGVEEVKTVEVEVVFEPPWEPTEELKASLGI